jgi:uncharacterized protein YrrD/ElaB/YqjD/DUF883 family membrane-anchored ribosome-binding protein
MSTNPDTLRYSALLRKPVLSKGATRELGWVEVVWMHPLAHQVLGFICRPNFLGSKRLAFNLNQLKSVGEATIVINSDPVEATAEQIKLLETLIGHELWDDQGQSLGRIVDCLFNKHTGVISDYLFRSEGWREFVGDLYQLPVHQIMNFDKRRVYISADATHWLNLYEEGLETRVSEVSDRLRENYTEVAQTWTEQAKDLTQQARSRLQTWTSTFKQQAKSLSDQAMESAKSFVDDLEDDQSSPPGREKRFSGSRLLRQIKEQATHLRDELQRDSKAPQDRFRDSGQHADRRSPRSIPPDYQLGSGIAEEEDWEEEDIWR